MAALPPAADNPSHSVDMPKNGAFAQWAASAAGRTALLLSLALLPLAFVALLSTLRSLELAEREKMAMLRTATEQNARKMESDLVAAQTSSRLTANALATHEQAGNICGRMQAFLRGNSGADDTEYLAFDRNGQVLCAPRNGRLVTFDHAKGMNGDADVRLLPELEGLIARTRSADGSVISVAFFGQEALRQITAPPAGPRYLRLEQDGAGLLLEGQPSMKTDNGLIHANAPVGASGVTMHLAIPERGGSILALSAPYLPLLMWIAAAGLGWLVVRFLLIQPIIALRRAVAAYRLGEVLALPPLRGAPREIDELAQAFQDMSVRVARHDDEMREALDRQTKLTREVHHRVKNNLQIIASLISLHSRTADGPGARAAYASIQRRVDALAVVQRNHYAEMEVNRGVSAPPLISEIAASLRASANGGGGLHPQFEVDADQLWLHQDVAAPVAFLIAELADLALSAVPDAVVRIALVACPDEPNKAVLSIVSEQFTRAALDGNSHGALFKRVLAGLSRQLRTALDHDGERGEYRMLLPTLP